MQVKIEPMKEYKDKVPYTCVHGKYPYKVYLEIKGNCKYGRYIVIVSNKELKNIDSISIKIKDKKDNTSEIRPDILTKDSLVFKVKEVDVFTVDKTPLFVFKPII